MNSIRWLLCLLLMAPTLLLAQLDESKRQAHLNHVRLLSEEHKDPLILDYRLQRYFESLPVTEAFQLELDIWNGLAKTKAVSRKTYMQGMLETVQKYEPKNRIAIDYWQYHVMLAGQLEKKKIDEDEYKYLSQKKKADADAAREAALDRREFEARQRYYAEQQAASAENAAQAQAIGNALQAVGAGIRRSSLRAPVTCMTGALGITTCQ